MNTEIVATNTTTEITATDTNRPRRLRALAMASLAALTLAVTVLVGSAQPASAWSAGTASRNGTVTLPAPQLRDVNVGGVLNATWVIPGPTATRSPATTGAQDVYVSYNVDLWINNTWTTVTQTMKSARIASGATRVTLPGASITPTSMKGYYRITQTFLWFPAGATANSQMLGYLAAIPTAKADLVCNTAYRPCAASAGYLQYGRLYSLGGGW